MDGTNGYYRSIIIIIILLLLLHTVAVFVRWVLGYYNPMVGGGEWPFVDTAAAAVAAVTICAIGMDNMASVQFRILCLDGRHFGTEPIDQNDSIVNIVPSS
jgi:hypothetical protein